MEQASRSNKGRGKRKSKPPTRLKAKHLQVYRSWCKKCGICVAFCPRRALEKDAEGFPRWKLPVTCVGCRMCELRCPDFAIEVVMDEKREDARED